LALEADMTWAGTVTMSSKELDPEVSHLYVAPGRDGSGIGRTLLAHELASAREAGFRGLLLWVLEQNTRARSFYEARGLCFDGGRHSEPAWLGEGVYEVRCRVTFDDHLRQTVASHGCCALGSPGGR
jgi:ribosomal protein S18 acetylase RimI-like enzyme